MTNTTAPARVDVYVLNGKRWSAERLDCPLATAHAIADDLLANGREAREVWIGPVGAVPANG